MKDDTPKTIYCGLFCDSCNLAFSFKVYCVDDAVSQWVCRFIGGHAGLEEIPTELRTPRFPFWKAAHNPRGAFIYQDDNSSIYSLGCFLENLLLV